MAVLKLCTQNHHMTYGICLDNVRYFTQFEAPWNLILTGSKKLEMVLNAKILIVGSLALEVLKSNQSLTGLGNAGLGGSEENVTLGPLSLSLLAVRPRYKIALLLLLQRITFMWYLLFKITGFSWEIINSLNIWDFLEGKTWRDTSGVGLLFRCWHVTDQHIGHKCLMWATQYRVQCYCSKLPLHSRDPVLERCRNGGRSRSHECQSHHLRQIFARQMICRDLHSERYAHNYISLIVQRMFHFSVFLWRSTQIAAADPTRGHRVVPVWSTLTLSAQTCWQKHHFRKMSTSSSLSS